MGGIIGGLFLAWILSLLNIDNTIIKGLNELFSLDIGTSGYYVLFAIAGLASELLARKRK